MCSEWSIKIFLFPQIVYSILKQFSIIFFQKNTKLIPGTSTATGEPGMWRRVINNLQLHNFKQTIAPYELKFDIQVHFEIDLLNQPNRMELQVFSACDVWIGSQTIGFLFHTVASAT